MGVRKPFVDRKNGARTGLSAKVTFRAHGASQLPNDRYSLGQFTGAVGIDRATDVVRPPIGVESNVAMNAHADDRKRIRLTQMTAAAG